MQKLVECVPNISEGRDRGIIDAVTAVIGEVEGARLLDVDPGADTNRTVITFIGPPEAVAEAAFRVVKRAAELIDMSRHHGAHPRHGATDVCPFVPVRGDHDGRMRRTGAPVSAAASATSSGIPVYLYESAALAARAAQPGRRPQGRVRGPAAQAGHRRMGARLRAQRLERAHRAHRRHQRRPRAASWSPTT